MSETELEILKAHYTASVLKMVEEAVEAGLQAGQEREAEWQRTIATACRERSMQFEVGGSEIFERPKTAARRAGQ